MLQALQFTEFSIMTAITYTIMASASMKTIHKGIIIKKKRREEVFCFDKTEGGMPHILICDLKIL